MNYLNYGTLPMKPIFLFFLIICCSLLACTPKNEEVTDEQIEVGAANEVLDTIVNTRKDAVRTDENNITPTLPMPQPVIQLLTQRYPGWEEPVYTEGVREAAAAFEQGPSMVRGDFNGDTRQDYALQLQQQNEIIIVAALDGDDGNWQLQELKKDIAFNERGVLKSPYLLRLADRGADLLNPETGKEIAAPYEAIVISLQDNEVVYLFHNGAFEAYNSVD